MKRTTEDGYTRTNREMAKEPRGRAFWWCSGCDGNHVANGEVCLACGHREDGVRSKPGKPVVAE